MKHSFTKVQVIIASVATVVSLAYSGYIEPPLNVDAKAHNRIAVNISEGNGYVEHVPFDPQFDQAITRSGPLLEYFMAGIYVLFGMHVGYIWIAHALLHGLSTLLVFSIIRMLFKEEPYADKAALYGSLLYALYPDLIESTSQLMTETSYFFLILLTVYLFISYLHTRTRVILILFSIVYGLTFLSKSTSLLYYPVILGYIFYKNRIHALLSLLIVLAVVSPWVIRNYVVFDKFIPSRIFADYTLYVGNHHGASGENDIEALPEPKQILTEKGVFAVDEYSHTKFIQFVTTHPFEYIGLHFRRLSIYFSWLRPTGHWGYLTDTERLLTFGSSGLFSVLVFTFGFAGLVYSALTRKLDTLLVVTLTLITPVSFILTLVETRYRYQIYPFLSIFAGYAIAKLMYKGEGISRMRLITAISFVVLLLNSLVDLGLNYSRFIALL